MSYDLPKIHNIEEDVDLLFFHSRWICFGRTVHSMSVRLLCLTPCSKTRLNRSPSRRVYVTGHTTVANQS